MRRVALMLAPLALALAACGSGSPAVVPDAGADVAPADAPAADGAPDDATPADGRADGVSPDASSCPRLPAAADRTRAVVVAHPYDETGAQSGVYEVLELDASGTLAQTGVTFEMARAFSGAIAFTPDGTVGIVAQDDGTLGVFGFDDAGAVHVIDAGFQGDFYADQVVMDPSGERAFVLDAEWRENGGGLHIVRIGCDGALADEGLYAAAKLPRAMVLLPGTDRAVVAAYDFLDSPAGDDAHLVRLTTPPARLGGAPAFGDDLEIVAGATVTSDGRYFLIGDNSEFSGIDTRIAAVEVLADGLRAAQIVTPFEDPVALVASPFGSPILAVSGYGNAFFLLDYDPQNDAQPLSVRGEMTYAGPAPQLPDTAVMIRGGALLGRVLVSENTGVRQVQFHDDGTVTDLGKTGLGAGTSAIAGALGVAP